MLMKKQSYGVRYMQTKNVRQKMRGITEKICETNKISPFYVNIKAMSHSLSLNKHVP